MKKFLFVRWSISCRLIARSSFSGYKWKKKEDGEGWKRQRRGKKEYSNNYFPVGEKDVFSLLPRVSIINRILGSLISIWIKWRKERDEEGIEGRWKGWAKEGCSDREEFHNLLIAHTMIAPLIYIYISHSNTWALGMLQPIFFCSRFRKRIFMRS